MKRLLSVLLGSSAVLAALSASAAAQEYSNGGKGQQGRGPAILSPVDAFGLNAPLQGAADGYCCRKNELYTPYYAPLSPTPTFSRWRTKFLTPYYVGYCSRRHVQPTSPYGCDGGCAPIPPPGVELPAPGSPAYTFGVYTGAGTNETAFWNMGGNGLVPYGAPPPPRSGPPDIVDMIQTSRGHGGPYPFAADGASPVPVNGGILPSAPPAADGKAR
jgi:hypothetical protein